MLGDLEGVRIDLTRGDVPGAQRATHVLISVAGAILQLAPGIDQVNGWVVLAALPTHLAVWWSVRDAAPAQEPALSAT